MVIQERLIEVVANQIGNNEATIAKFGSSLIKLDSDDPFIVCNVQECIKRYKDFKRLSPRVQQFYAMKCNPDPIICMALATIGCGFECASQNEIAQVLAMNVQPEKIVFMHPNKLGEDLIFAEKHKVMRMSFDSADELVNITKVFPGAEVIVRILNEGEKLLQSLGNKFGVSLEEAKKLIVFGKKLGSNIVGVTFHVGVGCLDIEAFSRGIKSIKELFDFAKTIGYEFKIVDIGGGFPGEVINLAAYSDNINSALDKYFPESQYPNLSIFSEFGQYYVASAMTLFTEVTGKTKRNLDPNQIGYFINESIFNSLGSAYIFSPQYFKPKLTTPEKYKTKKKYESIIYGSTPEKYDTINNGTLLPELAVGDWMHFHNSGGYTIGRSRRFAMTLTPKIHYICDNKFYNEMRSDTKLKLFIESDFRKL